MEVRLAAAAPMAAIRLANLELELEIQGVAWPHILGCLADPLENLHVKKVVD
jgi:hypothetical protein